MNTFYWSLILHISTPSVWLLTPRCYHYISFTHSMQFQHQWSKLSMAQSLQTTTIAHCLYPQANGISTRIATVDLCLFHRLLHLMICDWMWLKWWFASSFDGIHHTEVTKCYHLVSIRSQCQLLQTIMHYIFLACEDFCKKATMYLLMWYI